MADLYHSFLRLSKTIHNRVIDNFTLMKKKRFQSQFFALEYIDYFVTSIYTLLTVARYFAKLSDTRSAYIDIKIRIILYEINI